MQVIAGQPLDVWLRRIVQAAHGIVKAVFREVAGALQRLEPANYLVECPEGVVSGNLVDEAAQFPRVAQRMIHLRPDDTPQPPQLVQHSIPPITRRSVLPASIS